MKPFQSPTPYATHSLIGLCAAVELAMTLAGPGLAWRAEALLALVPARIDAVLVGVIPAPWLLTLVSHMFLHAGWLHLGLNMMFLLWVGRYVEWVTGRWALIGLFMVAGVAGGALQVAVAPHALTPVVGASGAIAGVFGAYAVMFARSRAQPRHVLGLTLSGEMLNALWLAAAWIGLQLLTALVFNSGGGGFAIWAHIGGFLVGLLLGRRWGRGPQIV